MMNASVLPLGRCPLLFFVVLAAVTRPRNNDIAFAFSPTSTRRRGHDAVITGRRRPLAVVRHAIAATPSGTACSRIKSAGAGVPLSPAGQVDAATMRYQLFDPAQEGRLQGTASLDQRLALGTAYRYVRDDAVPVPVAASSVAVPAVQDKQQNWVEAQHWLEHLDTGADAVPPAFAKATQPVLATVIGRGRVIGEDAPGDIEHVVLRLPDGMHYVEGQSLSVIPPPANPEFDKAHKPRLYSIASTRYGDLLDGNTVSLCVRRALYVDPVTGIEDHSKKGVCSNFLCDCQVGDTVQVAGPVGKTMLLPKHPSTDIIMVATGTGIAPFRGFLHRLFMENTVAAHLYTGTAWLILGVPTTTSLLYQHEIAAMQGNGKNGHRLQVSYAISREMKNGQGGKLYVQDVLADRITDVLSRLDNGAVMYFCGLKGMMPGILSALESAVSKQGLDWKTKLETWKKNGQWHVEVY